MMRDIHAVITVAAAIIAINLFYLGRNPKVRYNNS